MGKYVVKDLVTQGPNGQVEYELKYRHVVNLKHDNFEEIAVEVWGRTKEDAFQKACAFANMLNATDKSSAEEG